LLRLDDIEKNHKEPKNLIFDLEMQDISFSYEERLILEKIDLSFLKGSFISIVGPNGSGKSTLLRLMSAALRPNVGRVYINGLNIESLDKKNLAKRISFVPQAVPTDIEFSAMDVVMMGRYPYINRFKGETNRDIEIVKKAMMYTNTEAFEDRPLKMLSGGERQRVILAQAIAQEPDVLLLDEPVSSLDLLHQIEILSLLKKLCIDEKITVIAILHDLNMATTYSDYIVMLKNKAIAAQGLPEEVFSVEKIKEVFGIDVSISISPTSHKPYIYTLRADNPTPNGRKVHLICGGGSGSELMGFLYNCGYEITAGVLSAGDMDWKTARDLNINFVESIPFGGIQKDSYLRNLEMAEKTDIILVTSVYFGEDNFLNCKMLLEPSLLGKKVLLTNADEIEKRDFTEAKVSRIYSDLLEKGAHHYSEKELIESLEKARQLPGGD